ncbi:hypothetical protein LN996_20905, partial [Arthrobacter sp. AK01]|uniref:hypothetical protein n=1 Tax=Arthrobacter sp. AK01 TaxID=2894084 RepID=UPI001E49033A
HLGGWVAWVGYWPILRDGGRHIPSPINQYRFRYWRAWENLLFPRLLGPSLVLVFFISAAGSIAGMAAVRIKRPAEP